MEALVILLIGAVAGFLFASGPRLAGRIYSALAGFDWDRGWGPAASVVLVGLACVALLTCRGSDPTCDITTIHMCE